MKNEPAFPCNKIEKDAKYDHFICSPGMTLRDYFWGQALVGLLSNPDRSGTPEQYAEASLFYADALLKAREG